MTHTDFGAENFEINVSYGNIDRITSPLKDELCKASRPYSPPFNILRQWRKGT